MDYQKLLDHYRYDCDGEPFPDLFEEAVASLESYFKYIPNDELLHRSRPLALAYLALTDIKNNKG